MLWGTMLLDYDNEDDAKTMINPKTVVELVGVSEWDGKGRANYYPAGLLLVTRTRRNYYASCTSVHERDEWILHFKRSLECSFANNEIAPFIPPNIIQSRMNVDARNTKCPRTDYQVNSYSPKCSSCGRRFYSAEHVGDYTVLSQLGSEEAEKVCTDCKNAQMCIVWLKTMIYVQAMELHELTDSVLKNVKKFNASFQLRRRLSQRLDMAGELFTNGSLTTEEFEELRSVDHAYRREVQHDECLKLKHAVEAFGEDLQTILNILLNDTMTNKGGRNAYFALILRILELADQAPDLVDFYFPQLYQIHLQQLLARSPDSYIKVDCLQQALLVLAQKYPSFGLKLSWSLLATIGEYQEKRATQAQYAACVSLLLQLEMVMTGQISCIADVPTSKVLHQVLRPSGHQQQEIGNDISALFLIRRQLQEAYDGEEEARKERNRLLYGDCNPDLAEEKELALKKQRPLPLYPGTNHSCSCIELLYHLGVGQAPSRTREMASSRKGGAEDADGGSETNQASAPSGTGDSVFYWDGFERQIDFIGRLNALVDHLRFVDRPLRGDTLKKQLTKWNNFGTKRSKSSASEQPEEGRDTLSSSPSIEDLTTFRGRGGRDQENVFDHNPRLGWDPTTIAGEPHYRITRIIVDECRVFRTKARAPTMIVCEVMRDDVYRQMFVQASMSEDASSVRRLSTDPSTPRDARKSVDSTPSRTASDAVYEVGGDELMSPQTPRERTGSMAKMARTTVVANRIRSDSQSQVDSTQQAMAMAATSTGLVATPVGPTTASSAGSIGDSSHHGGHSGMYADPHQSFHDVDNLIVSSLNPVIAEMQLHRQQMDKEQSQQSAASPSRDAATSSASGPESVRLSTHLPRRKSGGILPTNRLSASTEGILRSSSSQLNVSGGSTPTVRMTSGSNLYAAYDANSSPKGSPHPSLAGSSLNLEEAGATAEATDNGPTAESTVPFRDDGAGRLVGASTDNGRGEQIEHIIASAQRLLKDGTITTREYEQLIMSDLNYREEIAREAALIEKSRVENVLGESFQSKKERILGEKLDAAPTSVRAYAGKSPSARAVSEREGGVADDSFWPAYDLRSFIVKTNDDLRQEICCMQLMQIFKEIFDHFGLNHLLYLKPYRIISTGHSSGVVEVLKDAVSLDALKHTPGFTSLSAYFKTVYETTPERLQRAKHNFMTSLAAYSLFSYILMVKDRHNGNLLLDAEGHIIHIDFGFLLSIAPGGSFSVETAPFKLTEEMVELLDGLDSPLFGEFVTAFTKGFIALQANCENIISAITILSHNSSFPCFRDKPVAQILEKLKARFRTELNVQDAVKHCLDLITNSYGHYGTRQYDQFQYFTNGIFP